MIEVVFLLIVIALIPGIYIYGKAKSENIKNNTPLFHEKSGFHVEDIYNANIKEEPSEHIERSKLSLGELLYSYKKPGDPSPDFKNDEGEYRVHSIIDLPLSESELNKIRQEYNKACPKDEKYTPDDLKIIKNAINRYVEHMFSDCNLYRAAPRLKKNDLIAALPLTTKEFNSCLKNANETYRDIYLAARMDVSAKKLPSIELIKVQFMAGYSDAESFRNAFKARHKRTPSEYKEFIKSNKNHIEVLSSGKDLSVQLFN